MLRKVNPLEVYYGIGTVTAEYVRTHPGLPIWEYDAIKRSEMKND